MNSLAFILKNYFVPAWEVNILKQLPHLAALQIIQIHVAVLKPSVHFKFKLRGAHVLLSFVIVCYFQ